MTDLTTLSPVEIDDLWAPIADREVRAFTEHYQLKGQLPKLRSAVKLGGWRAKFEAETIERIERALPRLDAAIEQARQEQAPFVAEWSRRGTWTRAYLVITNGQGHVHRTTACSTCYPTTQFAWLTELSGASEQEIVDQAGERACTICYASAPVTLRLDRPTTLFSQEEKAAQQAREERMQASREREAKRIEKAVTKEGRELVVESGGYRESFKTERAATQWLVDKWFSSKAYSYRPVSPEAEEQILAALADKHDTTPAAIRADLEKKLAAKAKREGVKL